MGVYFSIPSPPTSPSSSSSATHVPSASAPAESPSARPSAVPSTEPSLESSSVPSAVPSAEPLPPQLMPGTCSSFTDLPAFADALITQHLSLEERAPLSIATKRCRLMYLRHISALRINEYELLDVIFNPTEAIHRGDYNYRSRTLANLLQEMPHLSRLVFNWYDDNNGFFQRIVGFAVLLLPAPLKVEEIEEYKFGDACTPTTFRLEWPGYLSAAIAHGCLPFLRSVDIRNESDNKRDLNQSHNLEYLGKAITRGHLPRLTKIFLDAGDAVNALEQAYRERMLQEQEDCGGNGSRPLQANLHTLHVVLPDKEGHSWGRVSELLSLPVFGHLEELSLVCNISGDAAQVIGEELSLLAAYMQHTGGAPCLKELTIYVSFEFQDGSMGPLVEVLENGGAPNLEALRAYFFESRTMQELGRIYRAGRLANLKVFVLDSPELDEDGVRSWMEGVLASGHKGATLRILVVYDPNSWEREEDEPETNGHEASIVFIDFLRRGVFPNLECLVVRNNMGEFLYGDEMLGRFIQAMRDGAPCAKTLRTLQLSFDNISFEIKNEFRLVLPQVLLYTYTAKPREIPESETASSDEIPESGTASLD